jgi:hypothetical protein
MHRNGYGVEKIIGDARNDAYIQEAYAAIKVQMRERRAICASELMREIPVGARGTVNACKYRSKRADEQRSNTNDGDTSIRRA